MIEKNVLEELVLREYTIRKIAERCKCSAGTVRYWLNIYGLKTVRSNKAVSSQLYNTIQNESIQEAFLVSFNKKTMLLYLDLPINSTSYRFLNNKAIELGLDFSHFERREIRPRHKYEKHFKMDKTNLDYKICGIYMITCLITDTSYIGQSINIRERLMDHRGTAFNENDPCHNYPLYRAIRKYGIENFEVKILETCSWKQLNDKEKKYIREYDTFNNGYNLNPGGNEHIDYEKYYQETVIPIIRLLENTNKTHKEIASEFNINRVSVTRINSGADWHDPQRHYPIRPRKTVSKEKNFCIDCGREICSSSTRCLSCAPKAERQKRVELGLIPSRSELSDILRQTKSFEETGKYYNVTDRAICKWCKKYNMPFSSLIIRNIPDDEWDYAIEHWDEVKYRYGEPQRNKRVTEDEIRRISFMFFDGLTKRQIANQLHRDPSTIAKYIDNIALYSKATLSSLLKTLRSFSAVSAHYNVSDNAVRKWCRKYNMPTSSAIIKRIPADEWDYAMEHWDEVKDKYGNPESKISVTKIEIEEMKKLYDSGMTAYQIGKKLGRDRKTVERHLGL